MAKSSQSKNKKKKVVKRRPVRQSTGQLATVNPKLLRDVCSLTNPFCDVAKGARWPDNSHTKSVGYSYEQLATFATDSTGSLSVLMPVGMRPLVALSTIAGGYATYATPVNFPGTTPMSNVVRWRVTSYGVKVSCISTRMNTQGILRLRLLSPMNGSTLGLVPVGTPYGDLAIDEPLSRFIEKDMFVTFNPLGTDARLFRSFESLPTNWADWNNPGWQVLQVSVEGGEVSSTVIAVTLYANYEFVFDDSSTLQLMASPPPQNSMVAAEASASVVSRIGGFIEGTAKTVDTVTKSAAFKFLAPLAARVVGTRIGGPGAGNAAALMLSNYSSHAMEVD